MVVAGLFCVSCLSCGYFLLCFWFKFLTATIFSSWSLLAFFFWLADNYHLFCVVSSVVIIAPPHSGMIGKRSCSPRSRGYSLLFLVPDSNIIMVASGLADNFHLFCVVFFGRNHCLTQVLSGNVLGLQGRALGL